MKLIKLITVIAFLSISVVIVKAQRGFEDPKYRENVSQIITKPSVINNTTKSHSKCNSSTLHNQKMINDPAYRRNVEDLELQIKNRKEQTNVARRPAPYTIPVVFHVMYKNDDPEGSGTNISKEQLYSSIDALNRDFKKLADDAGIAQGNGAAMDITFCPAQRDPFDNPSDGIERINVTNQTYIDKGIQGSGNNGYSEVDLKALSKWDPSKYMNVWVVTEIDDSGADDLSKIGRAHV